MQYIVLRDEQEFAIEVDETSPNLYSISIDGEQFAVEAFALDGTALSLRFGNHQYWAHVDNNSVTLAGHRVAAEVLDLRHMALRRAQADAQQAGGPAAIVSPMAGKVAAVLVSEGQEVAEGEGLLVVEAMKMENELRAPKAGVVRALSALVGAQVDLGATLCRVE